MGIDRRDDLGPFDIVGDVHGCGEELVELLGNLGYSKAGSSYRHPMGRRLVFLGDLVDRGPQVVEVLTLVMDLVEHGGALCVLGNHDDKLARALSGNDVQVTNGLAESLSQLSNVGHAFSESVVSFVASLEDHYLLDGGNLVVAHAGLAEQHHGTQSKTVRRLALYGKTTGRVDSEGLPEREPWADDYSGTAAVVYGHTPVLLPRWTNNTINIDTGCVFGGELSALRWPERELFSVASSAVHYPPSRTLL